MLYRQEEETILEGTQHCDHIEVKYSLMVHWCDRLQVTFLFGFDWDHNSINYNDDDAINNDYFVNNHNSDHNHDANNNNINNDHYINNKHYIDDDHNYAK